MDASARHRRLVAAGLVALGGAALLAIAGAAGLGAAAAGGAALCFFAALRSALAHARESAAEPAFDDASLAQHGAVGADLLLATAWEAAAWVRRVPELPRAAEDVERALARWRERGWLERPEQAFAFPPPLEKPRLEPQAVRGAGDVELLSFASEFEPADPEVAAAYQAHAENRDAQVLLWRHRGAAPRPTLVSLHGFGMGRLATDVPLLRVRGWDLARLHRELGVDVAYVVLPFHGARTRGPSGAAFFDRHPLFATAALAQSVWELRRLTGWLRAQGAPAIGVHGISLGGLVAALYASLDGALAAAIPMNPAVDPAGIFWRQLPESRRREWRAAGLGPERLAEAWSLASPLRHRPRAPRAARLVIGCAADQIVPAASVRALAAHWEAPAIHWLPGAHLVWRGRDSLHARVERHLRETLLAERPPSVPPLSRFRS